ncbi:hypothetical protein DRQ07_06145 [candidate division KSB1 bacterium]|nr:MAG: hypothetical protein DRQ07_06145 [candidate division KSB1 bacterium]
MHNRIKILITVFILLIPQFIRAQGDIDLKFEQTVLTTYDFQITLMIRRASDKWDRLGSSNFPFYYNYNALSDPVLVSAHNFSGGLYSELNIANNGSWVSVNILYNGSDGQGTKVDTSWINVATIHFNITDPDQTSQINPRTDGAYASFDDDEKTHLDINSYTGLDVPLNYSDVAPPEKTAPQSFSLCEPFPNPFNMEVSINYSIPIKTSTSIKIISVNGKVVRSFYFQDQNPGSYNLKWDGRTSSGTDQSSGIYIVLFKADRFTDTKKITLIK